MLNIRQLSKLASGLTVLYVEDENEVRRAISSILKNIFTNILTASNGIEGIELVRNNKIDIIISDICMPKCDGLDMIKTIHKTYPQTPTILVTALENSESLVRSINLGVNKYIIKPVTKDKLFKAIEEVLYLINSRKKYQNEQITLSKNLKMIAISKLLANITHQWRQSLSVVSTACGGILMQEDKQVSDHEIQYLLNQIDTTVVSMDNELQDILIDFEKEHKKEIFSLNKVIEKALDYFQKKIDTNNIKIINEIEDMKVFNCVDSFTQILHQIIENAIDALTLNEIENKYIKICSSQQDNELIIDIIDNGGGILESKKDEIFEPYSTTKHQYVGTGLGLYIAYTLASKSLGGTIIGENILINSQKCAKFSIFLLK